LYVETCDRDSEFFCKLHRAYCLVNLLDISLIVEANEMMKAVKAAITEQRLAADLQLKQSEQR